MNCEKCQDLLSDFLDGHLSEEDHSTFSAHLEECLSCFHMRDEMNSIISFCSEHRGEYDTPPNSQAMWLRIRNTIESDRDVVASASRPTRARAVSENWWSRLMGRSWELSLPQMTGAVVAIMLAVSLITVYSIRRTQGGGTADDSVAPTSTTASGTGAQQMKNSALAATNSDVDDRLRQRQLAIDYWNERVEQRKARWNPQIRDAFDRSLDVVNEQVEYSRKELQRNPHDEISEEMLNDALNYKMELLKEFSDQ